MTGVKAKALAPLLSPRLEEMLRADGYETGPITVRQLMSHSAGLYDHGGDPRFTKTILADPAHVWTREELVRLSIDYADPQSAPGREFRYSDTGYILLGDIVERITGESVGAAVRRLLRLNRLGLASSLWEMMEPTPAGAPQRARQSIGDVDATEVHASMDLFGGRGPVMSARDLALSDKSSSRPPDQVGAARKVAWSRKAFARHSGKRL